MLGQGQGQGEKSVSNVPSNEQVNNVPFSGDPLVINQDSIPSLPSVLSAGASRDQPSRHSKVYSIRQKGLSGALVRLSSGDLQDDASSKNGSSVGSYTRGSDKRGSDKRGSDKRGSDKRGSDKRGSAKGVGKRSGYRGSDKSKYSRGGVGDLEDLEAGRSRQGQGQIRHAEAVENANPSGKHMHMRVYPSNPNNPNSGGGGSVVGGGGSVGGGGGSVGGRRERQGSDSRSLTAIAAAALECNHSAKMARAMSRSEIDRIGCDV